MPPTEDDSNLLNSMIPAEDGEGEEYSGQREIDSDEMDDEMMDEHSSMVQPGWKISDEQPASERKDRANWGER